MYVSTTTMFGKYGRCDERGIVIYAKRVVGFDKLFGMVLHWPLYQNLMRRGIFGSVDTNVFTYWSVTYISVGYIGSGLGLVIEAMGICTFCTTYRLSL